MKPLSEYFADLKTSLLLKGDMDEYQLVAMTRAEFEGNDDCEKFKVHYKDDDPFLIVLDTLNVSHVFHIHGRHFLVRISDSWIKGVARSKTERDNLREELLRFALKVETSEMAYFDGKTEEIVEWYLKQC